LPTLIDLGVGPQVPDISVLVLGEEVQGSLANLASVNVLVQYSDGGDTVHHLGDIGDGHPELVRELSAAAVD
jgi:hypothetical protein